MKNKMINDYCYDGLGFPILIDKVEMVDYQGELHPKIDVKKVSDQDIKELAFQKTRLTGNQVKFIRSYFSMPLREFGSKVVHESHTAVSKWEKKEDKVTLMNDNTEQVLRLYIIEQVISKTKTKQKLFFEYFQKSKDFFNADNDSSELLHISSFA